MSGALAAGAAAAAGVVACALAHPHARWRIPDAVHRRHRRLDPIEIRTAEWCERAARFVRSGSSLGHAVSAASDADTDGTTVRSEAHQVRSPRDRGATNACGPLRAVADHVRRGTALATAVDRESPCGTPAVDLVLTAVATCAIVGGPAAPTLERVASTLRTRAALADEIGAQSAQARLSASVLTLVPLALLVILVLADHDVRLQLQRPAGIATIVAGTTFNLCGWLWMRRLARPPS